MAETSMPWGGTTIGHATGAPYSADEWNDFMRDLFMYDRTVQGVIYSALTGYTGLLAVSNPAGTTARLATGIAIIDGTLYRNDANIDFACGTANNYYTIVLRKGTAAQTVVAVLLGPQLVTPPAVTQTDGTTWEVSIATVFNNAGTLVITDTRQYTPRVNSQNINNGVITAPKFSSGASWTLLAQASIGGAGGYVDWGSISQSYKSLKIEYNVRSAYKPGVITGNDYLNMAFAPSGILYTFQSWGLEYPSVYTEEQGSGVSGYFYVAPIVHNDEPKASMFSGGTILIPDYTSTVLNKGFSSYGNLLTSNNSLTLRGGGNSNSASAITRIIIKSVYGVNFSPGSELSLYGIP